MRIVSVCEASFGANTYLLISGSEAFVIDPAVSVSAILNAAQQEGVILKGILLTHGHFDHLLSVDTLRRAAQIPTYIHEDDAIMLIDGKKNAFYEFFGKERVFAPADRLLCDNDELALGSEIVKVINTPGHTNGSVCYLAGDILVTGDTIFADSFGRCDLWSGDIELMSDSLRRLRAFSPDITIYPGHGASAKLGSALDNVAYLL